MSIKQTIFNLIAITEKSNCPCLLVTNPGYGKTTAIKEFAEENNYHYEQLIGSQTTPEEILGYGVNNGGEALDDLNPKWFVRLREAGKNGRKQILFCDEISTCNGQVQGAMLSLIFDRKLKSGDLLPEDCVIIAAANYAKNLPSYMSILSPTMNRFCVINMMDKMTGLDICDELFNADMRKAKTPVWKPLASNQAEKFSELFETMYRKMFTSFSDPDSANGFIDIQNTELDGLYADADGRLLNFISLRTLDYYMRIIRACIELGITDQDLISKITDGLVGAGTGNFKNKVQIDNFTKLFNHSIIALMDKVREVKPKNEPKSSSSFNYGEKTVSNLITQFLTNNEAVESFVGGDDKSQKNFDEITDVIQEDYGNIVEKLIDLDGDNTKTSKFIADFQAGLELLKVLEDNSTMKFNKEKLVRFLQDYDAYYGQITENKNVPDVNRQAVFNNYRSNLYRCSVIGVKQGFEFSAKDVAKATKMGDIIKIGIRRVKDGQFHKLPFNSAVFENQVGKAIGNDYNIVTFQGDKMTILKQEDFVKLID